MLKSVKHTFNQYKVLIKHFFNRFFYNEAVNFGDGLQEKMIAILVILAFWSGVIANNILFKYLWFNIDKSFSWIEKNYFIGFCMSIIGLISVFEWDNIWPDIKDFNVLKPLPVKTRTFFMSKFLSLILFIGMFIFSLSILSGFIFANHLGGGVNYLLMHFIVFFTAGFFIFFLCGVVQGFFMLILRTRLYRKFSGFFQISLMIIFLISLSLSSKISIIIKALKESNSIILYFYPPLWFAGLYEVMIGNSDKTFHLLSSISIMVSISVFILFFVFMSLSYSRYVGINVKSSEFPKIFKYIKSIMKKISDKLFFRVPEERAISSFWKKAIQRDKTSRLTLGLFISFGVFIIAGLLFKELFSFKYSFAELGKSFEYIPVTKNQINKNFLMIPFIVCFSLLIGIRYIVLKPISIKANWIIRITEKKEKKFYMSGLKKGIIVYLLFPVNIIISFIYLFIWDFNFVIHHFFYSFILSIILLEVVFLNYKKFPFATRYIPENTNFKVLWFPILIAFVLYSKICAEIEYLMMKNTDSFFIFYVIISALFVVYKIIRKYFFRNDYKFIFDEKPRKAMLTLDINKTNYERGMEDFDQ